MLKQSANRVQMTMFIIFVILLVLAVVATVSATVNFPVNYKHGNGQCDQGYCEYVNRHCVQGDHCDLGPSDSGYGMSALLPK